MAVNIEKIGRNRWRIPQEGEMRTDGLVFASDEMIEDILEEKALEQVRNVATLPGIVGSSIAMPDIHWGYGFPIGGVAAFDEDEGVVSPGGVGYDINCGVRLLRSSLAQEQVRPLLKELADRLFENVPSGVGSKRKDLKLTEKEVRKVGEKGARWAIEQGFGSEDDLLHIEERGTLPGADPEIISERAVERGRAQLGTLGSGNHFLEVQRVEEIHDAEAAEALGLFEGQVTVTIHTGSRGFGYQICDDYLKRMQKASRKYGIDLPDRQLCCAPLTSDEGREYLAAMACGANFAFANRQLITDWVRETFQQVFHKGPSDLKLNVIYDVCHNIAKWETHRVKGKERRLCVHRKGATRAFPPNHPQTPDLYKKVGQPVLIPGDMGRYSYVLVGTSGAFDETFGSTCHGAGRVLSRTAAKKQAKGKNIARLLEDRGIILRAAGRGTAAEEISEAYKDVMEVVDVVENAGIGRIVAKLRPMAVVKG